MKETKESNKEIEEPINSTNLGSKKENQEENDYFFFWIYLRLMTFIQKK